MKSIDEIKQEIIELHKKWSSVGESLSDFKNAEYFEQAVNELLITYCEDNKYEIDGFPFVHRELSKTNDEFDDDYFSERYDLYLFRVAKEKDDVFELLNYYWNLFWPDTIENKEDTRNSILQEIHSNLLNFHIK
ncbi:hypothetical protein [Polaribacter gangjinensis]|uniref:Uncharacterized protein n=1 Tax=Polaribacter gangjinensis TaxID=574710 RepID=A0A2S7WAV3_9FLAO|nr:hypothetical protein [Polaribacter gangjinensis]PQJ74759.1 hypothetical protein BTO13_05605 [Polaribacter gangjinensis]